MGSAHYIRAFQAVVCVWLAAFSMGVDSAVQALAAQALGAFGKANVLQAAIGRIHAHVTCARPKLTRTCSHYVCKAHISHAECAAMCTKGRKCIVTSCIEINVNMTGRCLETRPLLQRSNNG
jgi:hypothetical protein